MEETTQSNSSETTLQTPAVSTPAPQQVQSAALPQKKSSMKKVLIVLGILLVLCIVCAGLCFGGGYFAVITGLNAVKTEVSQKVCLTNDSDIARVYEENTTPTFKAKYTEEEFAVLVSRFSETGCSKLKNASFMDFVSNAWTINSETNTQGSTITFQGNVDGSNVKIILVGGTDGSNYKIDDLSVS